MRTGRYYFQNPNLLYAHDTILTPIHALTRFVVRGTVYARSNSKHRGWSWRILLDIEFRTVRGNQGCLYDNISSMPDDAMDAEWTSKHRRVHLALTVTPYLCITYGNAAELVCSATGC